MIGPVTYYVADVVTGIVLDTLPLSGEVAKTRGEVEAQSWDLALPDDRLPDNWAQLIQPWKNMVVAEWCGRPLQGWVIVSDTFADPTVPLQGATLPRLLERTFVRDGDWYNTDTAQILAEIAAQKLIPDGGWSVQWEPTGTRTDRFYALDGAVSVYSAAETEQAADGGPLWDTTLAWAPGEEGRRVEKILQFGTQLGTLRPEAIFTARPGEYKRTVDWTGDNAALEVWGATEGSGGQGITETSYRSSRLDEGWHPNEAVVSFTDLDDEQLERRRDRRGRELEDGTIIWEATLRIDEQPVLGDEWNIGDTVTLQAKAGPYDPVGGTITAEVEGWVLNVEQGTVVPRMVQESHDD